MFVKITLRVVCIGILSLPFLSRIAAAQDNTTKLIAQRFDEAFVVSHNDLKNIPKAYHRQEVSYDTGHSPGTLIVDTTERFLYVVLGTGRAMRYGIGVGREGFQWSGIAEVGHKAPWPRWTPPKSMVARDAFAAKWAGGMPGGPKNPLGARALYLYVNGIDTLFRIHGTNQPSSIGQAVSSGCVRLLNVDIIDLYERVSTGTKVVVLETGTMAAQAQKTRPRKVVEKSAQASMTSLQRPSVTVLRERPILARKKVGLKPSIVRKTNFNLNKTRVALR